MRIYCILRTKKEKNIKFKGIKMKDNKLCDRDCSKCALQDNSYCFYESDLPKSNLKEKIFGAICWILIAILIIQDFIEWTPNFFPFWNIFD